MSLTDTLTSIIKITLNRYQLDIPSCTSPLDVEEFSGKEFMSDLYHYTILFTSSDKDITAAQLLSKPASLTMGTGALMGLSGQRVCKEFCVNGCIV